MVTAILQRSWIGSALCRAVPISLSGNGGYHLLFQRPAADIKGTKGLIWDGKKTGIDIQVGNQYRRSAVDSPRHGASLPMAC